MLETYGVKHTTSSPYYPKGNGKAEAAVKICKNMLKKASDFNLALLNYRNTPPQGHSYSPAERMMNRRTRTTLPTSNELLLPTNVNRDIVLNQIAERRRTSKRNYDRYSGPEHEAPSIGEYVYAKPRPTQRTKPWSYGQVTDHNHRSFTIKTPTATIRRNRIHIRPAAPPPYIRTSPITTTLPSPLVLRTVTQCDNTVQTQRDPEALVTDEDRSNMHAPTTTPTLPPSIATQVPLIHSDETTSKRSTRIKKAPQRFTDYVMT